MLTELNAENIEKAKEGFARIVKETRVEYNRRLSGKYQCKVFLKREDKQLVRSYKIRGAFNVINSLSRNDRKKGVVCASAGNHAQGVAICCNYFKIKGTIFMPKTTPLQKIQRTKKFGKHFVDIQLFGDTFDESFAESVKFANKSGATYVHPFDDVRTIIGQGTVGVEILEWLDEPIDYLIVPVGGGGLISGLALILRKRVQELRLLVLSQRVHVRCVSH